ncbi:hypothetical protein CC80DRAFT_500696 [Byssothecium circinans]|uniref:Uncharacterized protein n=1 Tax=Byssothecium circinans TaxID=147558 RepID=A0A6A5UCA9_9PLEO|nr:hypothetical protein CC80DRAFT_500696 [Byssothecium circinans]
MPEPFVWHVFESLVSAVARCHDRGPSDIWQVGLIIVCLIERFGRPGDMLIESLNECKGFVVECPMYSVALVKLAASCLRYKSEERPTAKILPRRTRNACKVAEVRSGYPKVRGRDITGTAYPADTISQRAGPRA